MRPTQAILSLLLLLLAGSCEPGASSEKGPPAPPSGEELYNDRGAAACVLCHAADGSGTLLGVDLRDKGAHWDEQKLKAYIADPKAYAANNGHIEHVRMPQPPSMSDRDRATLARYTLGLMKAR
jgi:mono/diheme cytochrome c family protein